VERDEYWVLLLSWCEVLASKTLQQGFLNSFTAIAHPDKLVNFGTLSEGSLTIMTCLNRSLGHYLGFKIHIKIKVVSDVFLLALSGLTVHF
jgi:hypothetical protein